MRRRLARALFYLIRASALVLMVYVAIGIGAFLYWLMWAWFHDGPLHDSDRGAPVLAFMMLIGSTLLGVLSHRLWTGAGGLPEFVFGPWLFPPRPQLWSPGEPAARGFTDRGFQP